MTLAPVTDGPFKGAMKPVRSSPKPTKGREMVNMTIFDAGHYDDQDRKMIIDSWPRHERLARGAGIPLMGSGRIFTTPEELVVCEPFNLDISWPQLGGMDFGIGHPAGFVRIAHNPDDDVVYVANEYKAADEKPSQHASTIKHWGTGLYWAWPHDGEQRGKGDKIELQQFYRAENLILLPEPAKFEDGSRARETGITAMEERLSSGRLRVFSTCTQWLNEYRTYHRKDGLVVKENDDLLDATRMAIMELRSARKPAPRRTSRPVKAQTHFDPRASTGWNSHR